MLFRRTSRLFCTNSAHLECTLEISNYIGHIRLQRHAKKNAIGKLFLKQLSESVAKCNKNLDVRAVVISSLVDKVFCAGADLKERKEMTQDETRVFVDGIRSLFCQIEDLNVPVISAIEGAALGGGLELALSTDVRIAGDKAKLGVPETALAIIPGAGGTQRLMKTVGLPKAKELVFTAEPVSAQEAEKIGLVNRCVPSGSASEEALKMAEKICKNGPIAIQAAKIAVCQGFGLDRARGMLLEQLCYDKVVPTKDRLEGLAAFAEKRTPIYRGE